MGERPRSRALYAPVDNHGANDGQHKHDDAPSTHARTKPRPPQHPAFCPEGALVGQKDPASPLARRGADQQARTGERLAKPRGCFGAAP
jgi:hypothetical protein